MAITTIYGGIEYRSRLEARWAAFFAGIGWHFTYEPFDGDGYIPDFLIHGERPLLVEVKPAVTVKDYTAPTAKAENGLRDWNSDILIVGADPLPLLNPAAINELAAGLLGEIVDDGEWAWARGIWMTCLECHSIGVLHEEMSYTGRPCGHYDGDHYGNPGRRRIQDAWANACNDVKWRGRAA